MPKPQTPPTAIGRLVFILAAMMAVSPFAIDAYLPTLPTIANELNAPIAKVELSLSLYLIALGFGQLTGGPLSDKHGRRRIIFLGLSLFIFGSAGIIFCQNLYQLLGFRIVQGFGGGIAIVNAVAVIRDISSGTASAKHLSRLSTIMLSAPMVAPFVGATIFSAFGWRAVFIFLLIYALVQLWSTYTFLPETHTASNDDTHFLKRFSAVITHRQALGYLSVICSSYFVMFAYVGISPWLYMEYFGVSVAQYPFLFGANVFCLILMNRVNIHLLGYFPPHKLLKTWQYIQLILGLALLLYVAFSPQAKLVVVTLLILGFFCVHGSTVANSTACIIDYFPSHAATAAAVIGAAGFFSGGLAGVVIGLLPTERLMSMALVMFGLPLMMNIVRLSLHRKPRTLA